MGDQVSNTVRAERSEVEALAPFDFAALRYAQGERLMNTN